MTFNGPEFVAFPKEMLTGFLTDPADVQAVEADLVAAGVRPENVRFLSGEEGLAILNPDGDRGPLSQRLRRKLEHLVTEGALLERVADGLRTGKTVVGVFDVKKSDEQRLRDVCAANGVIEVHYFGRWTIE